MPSSFKSLTIRSSIFPRSVKILFSAALTSDIRRQASDLCSKCCTSKQELRIPDEYWGSLSSVTSWEAKICRTTCHFDMRRTTCYQQMCPVVTASPENQKQSSWCHPCCERHLPKTWFKGTLERTQDFSLMLLNVTHRLHTQTLTKKYTQKTKWLISLQILLHVTRKIGFHLCYIVSKLSLKDANQMFLIVINVNYLLNSPSKKWQLATAKCEQNEA